MKKALVAGLIVIAATMRRQQHSKYPVPIKDAVPTTDSIIQPSDVGLNEIVVTASRNKETLGTVPSSITIISGKRLGNKRDHHRY